MGKKTFILGAALGAAIGLLLAPKPGKDTRTELKEKTGPMVKKFMAELEKVKGLDRKKYDQMVDKYVGQQLKKAKMAKGTIEDVVNDLKGQWSTVNKTVSKKKKVKKKPVKKTTKKK